VLKVQEKGQEIGLPCSQEWCKEINN
jgi:hypothetical protein